MKSVYISCSLTHVPSNIFEQYCDFIRDIAKMLEQKHGFSVKYALKDSDPFLPQYPFSKRPKKCYEWDRGMVEEADLVIAEVSFPSLGAGIELQIAEHKRIPVILIYKDYGFNVAEEKEYKNDDGKMHKLQIGNRIVSIIVQGNPAIVHEIYYSSYEEVIDSLSQFICDFKL